MDKIKPYCDIFALVRLVWSAIKCCKILYVLSCILLKWCFTTSQLLCTHIVLNNNRVWLGCNLTMRAGLYRNTTRVSCGSNRQDVTADQHKTCIFTTKKTSILMDNLLSSNLCWYLVLMQFRFTLRYWDSIRTPVQFTWKLCKKSVMAMFQRCSK